MAPDFGTVDVHEPGKRGVVTNQPRNAKQTLREAIDRHTWWREDIEDSWADIAAGFKELRDRFEADVVAQVVARKEELQKLEAASVVGNAGDPILAAQFEAATAAPPNVPADIQAAGNQLLHGG